MKLLRNGYEKLVKNTSLGMKKCRKHDILFTELCPACNEEEFYNDKGF